MSQRSFQAVNEPAGFQVALAARSELTRQGLRAIAGSLDLVKGIHFYDDPWKFFTNPENKKIDIIIICSEETPLDAAKHLATEAERYAVKTLLLLGQDEDHAIATATAVPSNGFMLANELTSQSLAEAMNQTLRGDLPIPSKLTSQLLAMIRRQDTHQPPRQINLTPREQQVLHLLAEGLSNKQIARRLAISLHGVKRLVANVLAKLNCSNRTLVVTVAINAGLLQNSTPPLTRTEPATTP